MIAQAPTASETRPRKFREPWIDAVRAVAVILVVLFHYLLWTHREITLDSSALSGEWGHVRGVLTRYRMPLLMAISGLLSAGAISRGWRGVRLRLVANYWLYIVWVTVFFAFYVSVEAVQPGANLPVAIDTIPLYLRNLVAPDTVLWFVIAMAVFPLALWLFEKGGVPTWLVLAFAVAAWGYGTTADISDAIGKFLRTFIYFAIGYYGNRALPRVQTLRWPAAVLACAGVVLATKPFTQVLGQVGSILVTCLAIVAVALLAPIVFSRGWHTRLLGFIGRRTLEIYVLHVPIIACISLVLRDVPAVHEFAQSAAGDAALVAINVSSTVVVALLLGKILHLIPGVMSLPEPWKRRLQ